jgi:hypothetical protein
MNCWPFTAVTQTTPSAALIEAIEKDPHGYCVNIHSKQYPGGAVRAQL